MTRRARHFAVPGSRCVPSFETQPLFCAYGATSHHVTNCQLHPPLNCTKVWSCYSYTRSGVLLARWGPHRVSSATTARNEMKVCATKETFNMDRLADWQLSDTHSRLHYDMPTRPHFSPPPPRHLPLDHPSCADQMTGTPDGDGFTRGRRLDGAPPP